MESNKPILEYQNGKFIVEGVETIDAELIGFAFKDWAESVGNEIDITLQPGKVTIHQPSCELI